MFSPARIDFCSKLKEPNESVDCRDISSLIGTERLNVAN